MTDLKHTPGPWRWELNLKSKRLQLCGGDRPQFDLTVMDFQRWGMSGATVRFRDDHCFMRDAQGMGVIVPKREHHAEWFQGIDHPDARLIAAAPDLLAALRDVLPYAKASIGLPRASWPSDSVILQAESAIAKATTIKE